MWSYQDFVIIGNSRNFTWL